MVLATTTILLLYCLCLQTAPGPEASQDPQVWTVHSNDLPFTLRDVLAFLSLRNSKNGIDVRPLGPCELYRTPSGWRVSSGHRRYLPLLIQQLQICPPGRPQDSLSDQLLPCGVRHTIYTYIGLRIPLTHFSLSIFILSSEPHLRNKFY